MVLHLLLRPLPLLLPIAASWWLVRTVGPWQAVLANAVLAALLVASGVLLLRTTRVGELSWRNRLAGVLLPWGYRFSGHLPAIAGTSWLVWTLLAVATALCTNAIDFEDPAAAAAASAADPSIGGLSFLLLLAWIGNGGLLLQTLGNRGGSRSLRRLQALFAVMLAVSIVLRCTGHTGFATLLAGGPPLAIGLVYGGYFGLLLLAGRNARWN